MGLAARLGLRSTDAASASLILNLEGVFTALLAWFAFGENFDRRVASGMTLIVGGGVSLSVQSASVPGGTLGVLAIVLGAPLTALLVLAGLWLHLTERHAHPHRDAAALHEHPHAHDLHDGHDHDPPVALGASHSHLHGHETLEHRRRVSSGAS